MSWSAASGKVRIGNNGLAFNEILSNYNLYIEIFFSVVGFLRGISLLFRLIVGKFYCYFDNYQQTVLLFLLTTLSVSSSHISVRPLHNTETLLYGQIMGQDILDR